MSDLISRSMYKSKLIKALDVLDKEYREAILNEDNDLICAIQNQQSAYMLALRLLDNEPTTYDLDKVVEELESFAKLAEDRWTNGTSKQAYQEHKCWVKAIEIVKKGVVGTETETIRDKAVKWNNNSSKRVPYEFIDYVEGKREIGVSDDVCEWHCDEYGRWHTECHYLADNDPLEYTYCPYCGKKIKVVE